MRARACRRLGSQADAEDIVQEARLRWAEVDDTTPRRRPHVGAHVGGREGPRHGDCRVGPDPRHPLTGESSWPTSTDS
ncbi:hypothetical protein [Ideonella lacteola]|uniref:hypothetical protein n=1 Tax=Ideonella lacteola TaxID=2984193 RepID=UPI003BF96B65